MSCKLLASLGIALIGVSSVLADEQPNPTEPQTWDLPACPDCVAGDPGGWIGGVGVYFVKPYWDTNPAFISGSSLDPMGNPTSQTDSSFDWDLEASPVVFVGYVGKDGTGVRAQYWGFQHSSDTAFLVPANQTAGSARPLGLAIPRVVAGGAFQVKSDLELHVVDVEVTHRWWESCQWRLEGSLGLRHVEMEQHYSFSVAGGANLRSVHDFDGVGPSIGLEGRRFFYGSEELSIFAKARGSLLFGDEQQGVILTDMAGGDQDRFDPSDSILSIGEIEIGISYAEERNCFRPFVQVSAVGQVWWGAGNASNSHLADSPAGGLDNSNLGLFGLRLAAGIEF